MNSSTLDPVIREFLQARAVRRAAAAARASVGMDVIAARARDAIRAAKFEEPPLHVQKIMRESMPEGTALMRADEMWRWAWSVIFERELAAGCTEEEARRAAARAMLLNFDDA